MCEYHDLETEQEEIREMCNSCFEEALKIENEKT